MANLPILADMSKTLFEYIKTINNDEIVTFVGTLMGISGYSLRDFIGKIQSSNFFHKLKDRFKEKEKLTEKQEKILRDCFLELEDYVKTCEELDEDVFKNMSEVILNGIDNEDLLTREYIKILKRLTWFDLLILMNLGKEYEVEKNIGEPITYTKDTMLAMIFNKAKIQEKNKNYPIELIQKSIIKLSELSLLNNFGSFEDKIFIGEKEVETSYDASVPSYDRIPLYSWKCYYLGKLGRNIIDLLNTTNEF